MSIDDFSASFVFEEVPRIMFVHPSAHFMWIVVLPVAQPISAQIAGFLVVKMTFCLCPSGAGPSVSGPHIIKEQSCLANKWKCVLPETERHHHLTTYEAAARLNLSRWRGLAVA